MVNMHLIVKRNTNDEVHEDNSNSNVSNENDSYGNTFSSKKISLRDANPDDNPPVKQTVMQVPITRILRRANEFDFTGIGCIAEFLLETTSFDNECVRGFEESIESTLVDVLASSSKSIISRSSCNTKFYLNTRRTIFQSNRSHEICIEPLVSN
jgi:hypothetical protein